MTDRRAVVVVASNRAADGVYPDRTGPILTAWLGERGFETSEPVVVHDGSPVREAVSEAVAGGVEVIVTSGGTGITPTDRTPEAVAPLLDRELPGLADAIRSAGQPEVPTAVLSRGVAGVAGRSLVVTLPGSTGGVRDGLAVLDGVLDHAVEQLHGGDHHEQHERPKHPEHHEHPDATPRGSGEVLRAVVTEEPLDVDEHAHLVSAASAGAVVTFSGVVRDHDHGREVRALDYSSHPSAGQVIERVAAEVATAQPAVQALAVSHRIGPLKVGESALACAVASAHRADAFTACARLVDEVKAQLPIWKRQEFADGGEEWVNCP